MRMLFFGLISLAGMAFCGFSLYSQAYGIPGIPLPPPFPSPLPIDALWGGIGLFLMVLAYSLSGRLSFFGFYWSCALAIIGFFLTYTFSFAPYSLWLSVDSLEYLMPVLKEGQLHITRIAGYPLFLLAIHRTVGLHFLPPIQLFCELFAYFVGGYLLLRCFQIWRMFSLLIFAFPFIFSTFIGYSFSVITEALFLAGFTLGGAALAAAIKSLDTKDFFWSGLGIALATVVKSIGIVLIVPIVLVLRFIPLRLWWKALIFSVLPPLALYGALCWSHYKQTGEFSAETSRGWVLLMHVSGFLDGDVAEPAGLSQSIKQGVKRMVIDQRPKNLFPIHSLQALEQYIATTVKEHVLAGQAIEFIAAKKIPDFVERDRFYKRLALTTIMHHPFLYLGHAGAHFYCMWTIACMSIDAEISSMSMEARSNYLGSGFTSVGEREAKRIGENLLGNIPSSSQFRAAQLQSQIPLLVKEIPWDSWLPLMFKQISLDSWWPLVKKISTYAFLFSAFSSLILIFIYVFSRKWSRIYACPMALALFINTYFFAHALFSYCGESRYAWVATPLVFFLFLTLLRSFFGSRNPSAPVQVTRVVKQLHRN